MMETIRSAIDADGVWLLVDIKGRDSFAENIEKNPMAPMMYGVSVMSCMSSALSEPGGAGLGTLGLPESLARTDDGRRRLHAVPQARDRAPRERVLRSSPLTGCEPLVGEQEHGPRGEYAVDGETKDGDGVVRIAPLRLRVPAERRQCSQQDGNE